MDWLTPYMAKHAELGVFLAIGMGYWIGKFKYKGVGFGPVTGSLIAGLVIGYSSTVAFGHILISVGGTALIWMLH